jgi:hypothetical protein
MLIRNIKNGADLQKAKNLQMELLELEIANEAVNEQRASDYKNPNKAKPLPPQYKTAEQRRADLAELQKRAEENLISLGMDFGLAKNIANNLSADKDKLVKFVGSFTGFKKKFLSKVNPEDLVSTQTKMVNGKQQIVMGDEPLIMDFIQNYLTGLASFGKIELQPQNVEEVNKVYSNTEGLEAVADILTDVLDEVIQSGLNQDVVEEIVNEGQLVLTQVRSIMGSIPPPAFWSYISTQLSYPEVREMIAGYTRMLDALHFPSPQQIDAIIHRGELGINSEADARDLIVATGRVFAGINDQSLIQLRQFRVDREAEVQRLIQDSRSRTDRLVIDEAEGDAPNLDYEVLGGDYVPPDFIGDYGLPQEVGNAGVEDLSPHIQNFIHEIEGQADDTLGDEDFVNKDTFIRAYLADTIARIQSYMFNQPNTEAKQAVGAPPDAGSADIMDLYRFIDAYYRYRTGKNAGYNPARKPAFYPRANQVPTGGITIDLGSGDQTPTLGDFVSKVGLGVKGRKGGAIYNPNKDPAITAQNERMANFINISRPMMPNAGVRPAPTSGSLNLMGKGVKKGKSMTKIHKEVINHLKADDREAKKQFKEHAKLINELEVDSSSSSDEDIKGSGVSFRAKRIAVKKVVGRGVDIDRETPTYKQFGKYVIHLPHLLNNGVANFKYPSLGSIPSIKPLTISPDYKDFLIDVLNKGNVNHKELSRLPQTELKHFEKVCVGAGLIEKFNMKRGSSDEDKQDTDRFNLLRGEYLAGNNAPTLIKELRALIVKFMNDGRIHKTEGLTLLMELSVV